jgi:hypothetical protein
MNDITVQLEEGQRQMVLLALAKLSVERPGWLRAIEELALKMDFRNAQGRPGLLHQFRRFREGHGPEGDLMNYVPIAHLVPGIRRYADHHIETGSFLRAFLENDLRRAMMQADPETQIYFAAIFSYLIAETPPECWGSPERVKDWLAAGRINVE